MPDRGVDRLASDEDRERAVALVQSSGGELGLDELERRLDAVVRARTLGQLATVVWDLHRAPAPARRSTDVWHSTGFRLHAIAYGLTNGFLLGAWALTGAGFFWPFFPAAGWGIWLGLHAATLHHLQLRKRHRAARRIARQAQRRERRQLVGGRHGLPPGRRRVVVMFTDIVDSTRLTEVVGDEEWSRLRSRHLELLRGCYDAHQGEEVSAQGDGCMAQFASSSDAVQCAIEVQRRLQAQREDSGFALAVRIGIHTGDALVETGDLLGAVVNMAARVMSEAAPGEILVTEALADQLGSHIELDDRGLRPLKGFARPRHLLAVCWEA